MFGISSDKGSGLLIVDETMIGKRFCNWLRSADAVHDVFLVFELVYGFIHKASHLSGGKRMVNMK